MSTHVAITQMPLSKARWLPPGLIQAGAPKSTSGAERCLRLYRAQQAVAQHRSAVNSHSTANSPAQV